MAKGTACIHAFDWQLQIEFHVLAIRTLVAKQSKIPPSLPSCLPVAANAHDLCCHHSGKSKLSRTTVVRQSCYLVVSHAVERALAPACVVENPQCSNAKVPNAPLHNCSNAQCTTAKCKCQMLKSQMLNCTTAKCSMPNAQKPNAQCTTAKCSMPNAQMCQMPKRTTAKCLMPNAQCQMLRCQMLKCSTMNTVKS